MNLFENLEKLIENKKEINTSLINNHSENISQDELELANKLDAIEEFTVDRFEGNLVVLENRKTQEMLNLEKEELPEGLKTGDIIKKINGKFYIDRVETEKIEKRIENKMKDLWG